MVSGRISFIGAGPGAADLITLRGANRIAEADVLVWTASLVTPECVRDHARSDAELVDSSRLTHEHALEVYRRAERERLNVVRVHSGDPALWGAVQDQYDACLRMDVEVEIVPGVAAFSAAAAAVGRELTVPEVAESLVVTRLEGGKNPMPDREHVRAFAQHGSTMALLLSAARTGQLVDELRAGGYSDETPVLAAYKVSWPDELLLRTTVGELASTVKEHKLWRHTLFLVGPGVGTGSTRAHAGSSHTLRRGERGTWRELRTNRSNGRRGWYSAVRSEPTDNTEQRYDAPAEATRTNGSDARAVDPDIAWWAVREWQADARAGNTRGGHAGNGVRTPARGARDDEEQPQLFGTGDPDDGTGEAGSGMTAAEVDPVPVGELDTGTGPGLATDPGIAMEASSLVEQSPTEQPAAEQPAAEQSTAAVPAEPTATATGTNNLDKSDTGPTKTTGGTGKSTKSTRSSGSTKQSRSGKGAKSAKSGGSTKGTQRRSGSSAGMGSTDGKSSG